MTWADCEAELAGLTERGTAVDAQELRRAISTPDECVCWESNRERVAQAMRKRRGLIGKGAPRGR